MDSTHQPGAPITPLTRPSPAGRGRVLLVLAGLAAISLLSPLAPAAADVLPAPPSTPAPPPLPAPPGAPPVAVQQPALVHPPPIPQPQPGLAPRACVQPAASASWRLVLATSEFSPLTEDPFTGCLYRALRGTLANPGAGTTLQRSSDNGATWQPVFDDAAAGTYAPAGTDPTCSVSATCLASTSPFSASGIVVPRQGVIDISEQANGDALVRSDDQGRTWRLADQGLAGQAVVRIIPTGDAAVSYALALSGSGYVPELFRSGDGERTWSAVTLPWLAYQSQALLHQSAESIADGIQVDPTDADHLVGVFSSQPTSTSTSSNAGCQAGVLSSRDGGATWTLMSTIASGCSPMQLLALHSQRHPLRLALVGAFADLATAVAVSDDGGRAWKDSAVPVAVKAICTSALVQDARDADHLLLADPCGSWWSTQDGLDHVAAVAAPPLGSPNTYSAALSSSAAFLASPASSLASGPGGSFLVNLQVGCSHGVASPGTGGFCAAGGSAPYTWQWTTWEVAPSTPSQLGSVAAPPSGAVPGVTQVPGSTWVDQARCAIPAAPAAGSVQNAQQTDSVNSTQSGSLAFDGYELLFTHLSDSPAPSGSAYEALIHATDPRTCGPLPDIDVSFDAGDVQTWASTNGTSTPASVLINGLTYDARCNCLWAGLATADSVAAGQVMVGLFQIGVTDGRASPRRAVGRLVFAGAGCGWALSYDEFRDSLWTCPAGDPTGAAEIAAGDGSQMATCMAAVGQTGLGPTAGPGVSGVSGGMATWAVGGLHHLYVAGEDDRTVWDYEPGTCAVQQTYVHRPFAEPSGENEQMACDPLTFGPDGVRGGTAGPTSVMWLRDAQGSLASSFSVVDASCPLPTVTTYSSPTPVVTRGSAAVLCATLQQLYPGGTINLPDMPISFSLVGPTSITVPVRATTLGSTSPPGCVTWPADVPAGQYTVAANFDPVAANREAQYRGSDGTGTLVVVGGTLAQVAGPRESIPPFAQPGVPANGPPASELSGAPSAQSEAVTQAQAQAQAQSQVQSLGNTQSVAQAQPGMMVQRQRQAQIATAHQQLAQPGKQSDSLMATRRSPVVVIAAVLMTGFGLIARRPRRALARSAVRGASDRSQR